MNGRHALMLAAAGFTASGIAATVASLNQPPTHDGLWFLAVTFTLAALLTAGRLFYGPKHLSGPKHRSTDKDGTHDRRATYNPRHSHRTPPIAGRQRAVQDSDIGDEHP